MKHWGIRGTVSPLLWAELGTEAISQCQVHWVGTKDLGMGREVQITPPFEKLTPNSSSNDKRELESPATGISERERRSPRAPGGVHLGACRAEGVLAEVGSDGQLLPSLLTLRTPKFIPVGPEAIKSPSRPSSIPCPRPSHPPVPRWHLQVAPLLGQD